ncbi:unnamed protein product [Bursaphelenchus okinawaensis]|uniref:Yip1 domain-containing protein n=1 Tax=Bursaphelenchus okinawaensis TaxID=465554 RepID=A0A811KAF5_9BILA|nr:unnamed protein product [Bursaphelenchus okinawaensis]CAG9096157.1 unnamed protein product [Bursaphelenchus okinawaensis]
MANLQFQDFSLGGDDSPFTSVNSSNDQRDPQNTRDNSNLIGSDSQTDVNTPGPHFLSFQFYKQYFDVDTDTVQSRILGSFVPKMNGNFIRDNVQPTADLYGPFWVSVTLVFFAAICGNFAHYIDTLGDTYTANDFRLVTGVATLIFLYVTFVPLLVYTVLWYRQAAIQYSFIELLCTFGYSLSIFIPVSILWIIHFQFFRWGLIIISVALSGTVLATTVWEAIRSDKNKLVAFALVGGVIVLHSLLAIGIKELYFDTVIPNGQPDVPKPLDVPTRAALIESKSVNPTPGKAESLVRKDEFKLPDLVNKNGTVKTEKRETEVPKLEVVSKNEAKDEGTTKTDVSKEVKEEKTPENDAKDKVKDEKDEKKTDAKVNKEEKESETATVVSVVPEPSVDKPAFKVTVKNTTSSA